MPPTRGAERRDSLKTCHRIIAALIVLAMPVLFSACFWITWNAPPEPETPIPGFDADKFQVQKLTDSLAQREKSLDSMQTHAVMEYTAGGQHLKAKEEIVAQRPNNLRVEALSPFGVALLLAAQGTDLAIFEPGQNRFMRGAATAETLNKYVRIPMAPADAVGLLMGLAPHDFALDTPPASVTKEGDMTVATYADASSTRDQLGFQGGNLAMVRRIGADGRVVYEVRYSDYHDIGGVMFPYVVDANFPLAQSRVTFHFLRPIVNGKVPESTFVLTPAPGAILMNLSLNIATSLADLS
jgi:outer membrane lipoprotein-sorting protein